MSTRIYPLPVEETRWAVPTGNTVVFDWQYDEGRDRLLALYERGKRMQWDAHERIDWSRSLDPDNPPAAPDWTYMLDGAEAWEKMDAREQGVARLHQFAWQISQFLHGEQGALLCTSRIVESVPQLDAKFYAATQVVDEARHVEVFSRLLRDKIGLAYPINPHLRTLLDGVLSDSRWDMIYLGMQVLIEGLALAAFALQRDHATDPLVKAATAYVMQDEARHVAFGRLTLREVYPQLSEKERDEREEFVVEASRLMRDRFLGEEIWARLGLPVRACVEHVERSEIMRSYRQMLFSRIVPTIRDIGLWGPRVRDAYEKMGVLGFASLDPDELSAGDEAAAREIEARRGEVAAVIEAAA